MGSIKPVEVGDELFIVREDAWGNFRRETLGNFVVTGVNNSSFYARPVSKDDHKPLRFNRKTWVGVPYQGARWKAYTSERGYTEIQTRIKEHELLVSMVQAEAKNLDTKQLKEIRELMKDMLFKPKRKKG